MVRVAVVGGGIVGLATAFAMQQRGAEVTVLESGPPGGGQSTGRSRIFRHAHTDPRLVEQVVRSRALWREWEDELGVELVAPEGVLAIGDGVPAKVEVLESFPEAPVRLLTPPEVHERMPVLATYDGPAMLDVRGGAIRTTAAVGALSERLAGSLVADHVLAVRPREDGSVEVRTGTDTQAYDHVVLCAGRGTAGLARGAGLELPVEVEAHVRVTVETDGRAEHPLPAFQDGSGAFGETGVYASPYPDSRHLAVGLNGSTPAHPDGGVARPDDLAALADRTVAYVQRAFPGLRPVPVDHVHCWVTRLPWGEDGVGVWSLGGVTAVAGHNLFKQAPVLGETLAVAAMTGAVPPEWRQTEQLGRS